MQVWGSIQKSKQGIRSELRQAQVSILAMTVLALAHNLQAVFWDGYTGFHVDFMMQNSLTEIQWLLACPDGLTQCMLYRNGLAVGPGFESRSGRIIWFKITSACFEITFLDMQTGSAASLYNPWPLVTYKNSGVWISSMWQRLLLKSRTSRAVADLARLNWTSPRFVARQTEVIWELAWPVGVPSRLLGLWVWVGDWRDHMLPKRSTVLGLTKYASMPCTHIQSHTYLAT